MLSFGRPPGALRIQDATPTYDHINEFGFQQQPHRDDLGKWSARLTPERIKQLAECLVAGRTRKETAEALGVSERTVSRWKKDPRVLAEVERLRNGASEIRAVQVLLELLDSWMIVFA